MIDMDGVNDGTAAAVGFTVKSGWAAAVLLSGSAAFPRLQDSRIVALSDPAVPSARQPYHDGFGTARADGPALRRLVASVERFGGASVARLLKEYGRTTARLRGVGVIAGSLIDPERTGNDHIRIHAREGQLFRGIVQHAALRRNLTFSVWRERDVFGVAAAFFRQPESDIRLRLASIRTSTIKPWRNEQKAAALAAWLVLAGCGSGAGNVAPRATRAARADTNTRRSREGP